MDSNAIIAVHYLASCKQDQRLVANSKRSCMANHAWNCLSKPVKVHLTLFPFSLNLAWVWSDVVPFDSSQSYFTHFLSTSMTAMARLEAQENIEYYQWLFRIEREQFEKELLEIVSENYIFLWFFNMAGTSILQVHNSQPSNIQYFHGHLIHSGFHQDSLYSWWGGADNLQLWGVPHESENYHWSFHCVWDSGQNPQGLSPRGGLHGTTFGNRIFLTTLRVTNTHQIIKPNRPFQTAILTTTCESQVHKSTSIISLFF